MKTYARRSKIARLPHHIREQLNRRLDDGEEGKTLVAWLNKRDRVKQIVEEQFDGKPITEQNLSEWRKGGYVDWQERQERCALMQSLMEEAGELEEVAGEGTSLAARMNTLAAAALGRMLRVLTVPEAMDDPLKRAEILAIAGQMVQLRRAEDAGEAVRLKRERWEDEHERRCREENEKELKAQEWKDEHFPMEVLMRAAQRQRMRDLCLRGVDPDKVDDVNKWLDEHWAGVGETKRQIRTHPVSKDAEPAPDPG